MAGKRRFRGPEGAIFVPNVDEDTIAQKVKSGEWTEVVDKPAPAKRARKAPSGKSA